MSTRFSLYRGSDSTPFRKNLGRVELIYLLDQVVVNPDMVLIGFEDFFVPATTWRLQNPPPIGSYITLKGVRYTFDLPGFRGNVASFWRSYRKAEIKFSNSL
jgi:hypothetical protein